MSELQWHLFVVVVWFASLGVAFYLGGCVAVQAMAARLANAMASTYKNSGTEGRETIDRLAEELRVRP